VWRDLSHWVLAPWITGTLLVYSFAIALQYLVLGLLAMHETIRQRRHHRLTDRLNLFESDLAPPISVLVPAYNEEPTIVESVRALMQLHYPSYEIVVVNDGSRDGTLAALLRAFVLRPAQRTPRLSVTRGRVRGVYSSPECPFLSVVDVANGGKAQALNIALAFSRHPLVLAVDADTVIERETLVRLALPFYEDASVLVTGGVVRPSNGCHVTRGSVASTGLPRSLLARLQVVEYLRGMLAGRLGWAYLDSLFIVSGALGLFSRDAVVAVGGYRTDTLGEDMDLVMRIQRWANASDRRLAVRFVGSAVAWTEVPENLSTLARQRRRWHQGLAESLWLNRELLFAARFRFHHGMAFLAQLCFELLGPLVELMGLALLGLLAVTGRIQMEFVALYAFAFFALGTLSTLLAIGLERIACPRYERTADLVSLAMLAVVENLGYRQLTAVWRVQGLWHAMRGRKVWGAMERVGHRAPEAAGSPAPAPGRHDVTSEDDARAA
jgi:cellulose synthase/poly-beta-1,6-N-acetylglucosamine synthase-like glycosyltransferase